jgi:branched-chain amino acid transport system substrate-binding protein
MQAEPPRPKTRWKTRTVAIIIIIIAAVAATSAGGAYYYINFVAPHSPCASGSDTIKVGFTISLTGTYNVEGTKSLAGIKAAASWINDNGGVTANGKTYNIALCYYDDQSSSSLIPSLYTKLITQDHVQFLLAPYSSPLTGAAAPLAEQYNLVMLSHGGSSDSIWTKGYKNVFGVLSAASTYFNNAIDWIKANHPTDKLAFLYAEDSFSKFASAAATRYATSQGLTVVYNSSYPATAQDLSTPLSGAKLAGAVDLLGGGHLADGEFITKQLSQVGWTPHFISLLVAVTEPEFQQQLGSAANLVTGPSQWETSVAYSPVSAQTAGLPWYGPNETQFVDYYSQQSNAGSPTYHSGEAGAAILVLADAIGKANSIDTTSVRQTIMSLDVITFFGEFRVDSTGKQAGHSMVLVQWQGGKLVVVAPGAAASGSVIYPYTGS